MDAIYFIVHTLLQVLLVTVFLLRFLLPLVRADARNQLSQAVIRITNPIVLPLRRLIPPIGRIDTASLVALLLVQSIATITLLLLQYAAVSSARLPGFMLIARLALLDLAVTIIQFYSFAVLLYALFSWVAPGAYSPAMSVLRSLCEPLLRPVRRLIPPFGGLDLSALFILIGLQALLILLRSA
jgi:YggT family protein